MRCVENLQITVQVQVDAAKVIMIFSPGSIAIRMLAVMAKSPNLEYAKKYIGTIKASNQFTMPNTRKYFIIVIFKSL